MPTLQGALLCDAARDYNGLVSVLGGFVSILVVPDLPVPAPVMFAGRVGFSNEELLEEHHIVVKARREDGETLPQADNRRPVARHRRDSGNGPLREREEAQGRSVLGRRRPSDFGLLGPLTKEVTM
jgi:hypothetical protein